MQASNSYRLKSTAAAAIALFGMSLTWVQAAPAAESTPNQNGSVIKNLMAPTYRAPAQAAVPQGLTGKEARKLAAAAESREDHLKLARYYKAEADSLDAEASGYEVAAAAYRHGPIVKNLTAPSTAARYEYFANEFRSRAKSNRGLAALHQQMAGKAVASL